MVSGIKIIINNFIILIQRLIVLISLFLVYILGFGLTAVFMLIFKKKFFENNSDKKDTFWNDPDGYNADINEALRQS